MDVARGILVGWDDIKYDDISTSPIFTKRTDILSQDLARLLCYNDRIALKIDNDPSSAAADVPVKFRIDWKV